MEHAIVIILSVMGAITALYVVIFLVFPMAGKKKAVVDPLVEMHTIEIPVLNKRAEKIVNHSLAFFRKKEKIDLRGNRLAYKRLCDAAIKAEMELRAQQEVLIKIPFIIADQSGSKNLELTIFRDLLDGR